ncbi:hypothetical protein RBB50_012806 [Rhinocladiella similis]
MAIIKGYVDTTDGQIHYRKSTEGSGAPIVFFHMTASSSACYENLMRAIEGKHPLIAIDSPHYGQSFWPTVEPSIAYMSAVIMEALTNMGVNKFHAFGQHTGCNIAVQMAVSAPERLLSISLNGNTYIDGNMRQHCMDTLVYDNPITPHGGHLITAWTRVIKDVESIPVPAKFAHQEVIDTLLAGEDWHWGYCAVFSHDMISIWPKVQCPIFLNCGISDVAYPSHCATKNVAPNARVHEAEGHGCYYIATGAADLGPPLLQFIDDVVAGKAA